MRLRGFLLWGAALLELGLPCAGASAAGTSIPARPSTSPPFTSKPRAFNYVHLARPMLQAKPGERVLLSLGTGAKKQTFTLAQLRALPAVRYTTYHPQLRREFTYEGVPLRDLAQRGGFAGQDLRVYASNGFVAHIYAQDYLHEPIMLAYLADGQPIPVLQKGPLTVVLPKRPERFGTPSYSAAWVWFVTRITPIP